jgi:S1-C subfamily serine protease
MPNTRLAIVCLLTISSTAAAQQIAARACASGNVVADLGYDGTSCVNCTVYNGSIEYLTEPSISQIREGGPAEGKLRENDVLVAIDGSLITTRAAWRKMRSLSPGDPVTLTVRRNGAEREVTITPDSRCVPNSESAVADDDHAKEEKRRDDRFSYDKFKDDRYFKDDRIKDEKIKEEKIRDEKLKEDRVTNEKLKELSNIVLGEKTVIVGAQSGYKVGSSFSGRVVTLPNAQAARVVQGMAGRTASSTGWIGIGLECSRCTPVNGSTSSRYRWRFEDPPSIVEVVGGSPAAHAGLRAGDLILQIDGYSLTSPEGGRRWGDIRPGDEVSLTIRRGLERKTLSIQAEERPAPNALRREGRLSALSQGGLAGRTLLGSRFSVEGQSLDRGSDGDKYQVGGAMVELKGRATSVQYDRSTGELVIVGPDFTVRVRPREER